jgi:hypothetical protein
VSPSVPGVRGNARTLLSRLSINLQEYEGSVNIPLVSIGHGMGGIIIKQVRLVPFRSLLGKKVEQIDTRSLYLIHTGFVHCKSRAALV